MSTWIIVAVIVVLLVIALRLWMTANRLDRLHIRTNAAWVALDGALQLVGSGIQRDFNFFTEVEFRTHFRNKFCRVIMGRKFQTVFLCAGGG